MYGRVNYSDWFSALVLHKLTMEHNIISELCRIQCSEFYDREYWTKWAAFHNHPLLFTNTPCFSQTPPAFHKHPLLFKNTPCCSQTSPCFSKTPAFHKHPLLFRNNVDITDNVCYDLRYDNDSYSNMQGMKFREFWFRGFKFGVLNSRFWIPCSGSN